MLPLTTGLERVELPRPTFELRLNWQTLGILKLVVEAPSSPRKRPVLETIKTLGSSEGNKGNYLLLLDYLPPVYFFKNYSFLIIKHVFLAKNN